MNTNEQIKIRDLRKGDWYWIDKAIIKEYAPKIGAMGIAVYNLLASLSDNNQRCFPSQKYVAEHLGYSRATVNRTVKLLEKYRLVRISKKSRYHCVYHLLKIARCNAQETQVSNTGNSGVKQVDTNDNKLTIDINNPTFNLEVQQNGKLLRVVFYSPGIFWAGY